MVMVTIEKSEFGQLNDREIHITRWYQFPSLQTQRPKIY